ncbi:MAG TPA: glutaredoxin family protein, partial [Dehalococcoidia bacterium]|nr:glutaredoxin family protein [Dehalococcoidia bacterium]
TAGGAPEPRRAATSDAGGGGGAAGRLRVTLFTQEDCGLCREAEALLRRLRRRIPFELEVVDIESDETLLRRYWDRVPVVAVDGGEVAAAPLEERHLGSLLSAGASR